MNCARTLMGIRGDFMGICTANPAVFHIRPSEMTDSVLHDGGKRLVLRGHHRLVCAFVLHASKRNDYALDEER